MLFFLNHPSESVKSIINSQPSRAVKCLLSITLVCTVVLSGCFSSIVFAQDEGTQVSAADGAGASDAAEGSSQSVSSGTEQIVSAGAAAGAQYTLLDPQGIGAPEIDGKAYVLYDVQSGTFLLGNNQDTPLPPASITKVMTILLAFENLQMTDTITVTRDMYESIPNDYVRLGLVEGEQITVEEAIYACLLISANDACMALAVTMGGSVEGFSKMMNEKAVELGCTHTYFTNPYGFSDENHLTTAHDMALMMAAALKNEAYTKISTTANYTMPATNKYDEPRSLTNGNRFVSTTTYAYDNYIGGKTGFTDLSAYTIAAGARQDGRTLVGVVLGASCSEVRYSELISLFTYGFKTYSTASVDPAEFTQLQKQTVDQVSSGISSAGYALEITDVTVNVNPYITTTAVKASSGYSTGIDISQAVIQADLSTQTLVFPLYHQYADSTRDQVGTLTITICDQKSAETAAQAAAEANKPKVSILSIIVRAVIILVLVLILTFCIIIYVMLQKEKKKRRNRRRPRVL